LLDDVIQVLDLAHDDPLPLSGINGFESRNSGMIVEITHLA